MLATQRGGASGPLFGTTREDSAGQWEHQESSVSLARKRANQDILGGRHVLSELGGRKRVAGRPTRRGKGRQGFVPGRRRPGCGGIAETEQIESLCPASRE